MRLNITLDDETAKLVKEMAAAQSRTITGQVAHLVRTHNEAVGWRAFKAHQGFTPMLSSYEPVKVKP